MEKVSVDDSFNLLNSEGFCLWVGNGLTMYLQQISNGQVQTWDDLLSIWEKEIHLESQYYQLSYPERLQKIQNRVGIPEFQKKLRKETCTKLAKAILNFVKMQHLKNNNIIEIPTQFINIIKLGGRANPIVNFNIETLTSYALGGIHSNFLIRPFRHYSINALRGYATQGIQSRDKIRQQIYHPHGALVLSGRCVMTEREYNSHKGSLAFQLAVHSAFGERLAIVGMSLQDNYLRDQIQLFRDYVTDIYWYVQSEDELDAETKKWIWMNDITIVEINSWENFWDKLSQSKEFLDPKENTLLEYWSIFLSTVRFYLQGEKQWEIQWLEKNDFDSLSQRQRISDSGFDKNENISDSDFQLLDKYSLLVFNKSIK